MVNILEILKISLGVIFVLYLPGFFFTFLIWKRESIDLIERSAFALLFSLVLVPLVIFYFNYLTNIEITPSISSLVIWVAIGFFGVLSLLLRRVK